MRAIDWNMALAARNHWQGKATPGVTVCSLLGDLDCLLKHLNEAGIRPGDELSACPACGDDHRWALLKQLMIFALALRPADQSQLLTAVNQSLEADYELYGGEAGYRKMQEGAEAFFAKVGAKGKVYTP